MNNSNIPQSHPLRENQEVFSFETMKIEFISIIDRLLEVYKNSLYSDENIEEHIKNNNKEYYSFLETELKRPEYQGFGIGTLNMLKVNGITNNLKSSDVIIEAHRYIDTHKNKDNTFDRESFCEYFDIYFNGTYIQHYLLLMFHVRKVTSIPEIEKKKLEIEVSTLIDGFISEYQEYFNIDLFRNIFGSHFSSEVNPDINERIKNLISHKIALKKDDIRTKGRYDNNSHYNIEKESGKCKGEIDEFLLYDQNLLGYVIFDIFKQKVGEVEKLNDLLYWIEILQSTQVFTNTITRVEIDNFLFKYREQLNITMYHGLISSDKGEEVVQEIIATPENTTRKMDAIIFVMEYCNERFKSYIPKLFEVYISGMKDKKGISDSPYGIWCSIDDLRKIYKYYKENKAEVNPELDVEGAFENYSKLFVSEDFKGDLDRLYCGDLPISYIKIAFSGLVKEILDIQDTTSVEIGLFDGGAINLLFSNIGHGSYGLPGFYEKIELSNNEINSLQELGYDTQDGLKMSDYIKSYTSLIRKILYSELNLRIYGDNEKISKGLTKNYIKAKKELDSMMSKILCLPEEVSINSGCDIEKNTGEEGGDNVGKKDGGDEIPF